MIKLIVKLAIVALLANAVFRVGTEYVTYVKFRDSVRDAAMFKATTEDDLRQRILDLAEGYDVPVDADAVQVSRDQRVWTISAPYKKPIELAPRFQYDWPFPLSIQAVVPDAPRLPGAPPR